MRRMLIIAMLLAASPLALSDDYLIENVRIFNGVDSSLTKGHVLVSDGLIKTVSSDPIQAEDGTTVIDGGNRVLSPGFIDLHVHLTSHVPYNQPDAHGTVVGAVARMWRDIFSIAASRQFAMRVAHTRISRKRSNWVRYTDRVSFRPVPFCRRQAVTETGDIEVSRIRP